MQQHTVESPEALSRLADQCDLENAHVRIRLLQPLTYKSVFDQNRAPETRFFKDSSGRTNCPCPFEHIHLKLLSQSWRKVWSQFPVVIDRVTFDLSVTCECGEDGEDRVVWQEGMMLRDGGGIEVDVDKRGVILMVSTLGTVMHVRSRGKVKMDILPPSDEKRVQDDWRTALDVMEEAFEALATGGRSHMERKAGKGRAREKPDTPDHLEP